jgi:hypothetical protein
MSQSDNEYNRVPHFNGKDFPVWKMKILAYLGVRGLAEIIQRKLTPEEKETGIIQTDLDKMYKAYSILLLALSNEQARFVMDISYGDANGIWQNLIRRFERITTASKSHTRTLLGQSEMKEDELFDSYLARIKELQVKLIQMGEAPSQSDLRYILLKGLPESYNTLVESLDVNNLIDFDEVCDHIRDYQEKRQIKLNAAPKEPDSDAANYAAGRSRIEPRIGDKRRAEYMSNSNHNDNSDYNKTKSEMKCFTCDKSGHRAFDCYSNENKKKCYYCRKVGHTDEECRSNKKKQKNPYVQQDSEELL